MLDELTSLEASEDDALLSMLLVLDETLWASLELPASVLLETLDALASLKTSVDELTALELPGLTALDSAELVSPVLSVEELVSVEANEVDSLELTALVLSLELTTLETVALLTADEVVLPVLLLPEPPQPASVMHETASVHTNLESVVAIIASLYNFYC